MPNYLPQVKFKLEVEVIWNPSDDPSDYTPEKIEARRFAIVKAFGGWHHKTMKMQRVPGSLKVKAGRVTG